MVIRILESASAALFVGLLAAGAAAQTKPTLRAITSLPPNVSQAQSFIIYFAEATRKDPAAPVAINFLGGPEVQPPNKAHNAVQRGVVEMLHGPAGYYAGQVPESFALMGSRHTVGKLWESGAFDVLQPIWAKKLNARILAWGESNLPMHIWTQFEPKVVERGPDLKGKKIRTTPTYRGLLAGLGATPVNMPAGDIYTGLQRGVIDGFAWPETGVPQLGVADMVKYRIDPGFYRANSLLIINLDSWNRLNQAQKDYLVKTARSYEAESEKMMLRDMQKEEKELIGRGMKLLKLEGAQEKAFLKVAYDAMWARLDELMKGDTAKLREKFYTEIK
jgi:TRAP-type C4-dicarboxylate transport system substrate-binding protein